MDIVIVAQYMVDINDLASSNSRFWYIAQLLAKHNHQVEIITSDFSHRTKSFYLPVSQLDGIRITMCHERGYPTNICLKRFISHHDLSRNIQKYLKARKHPDVVYAAVPSLSVAGVVAKYCNRNSIKFIVDIQDLWPEAFKLAFHVPIISDLLFAPMKRQANYIYKTADEIVAVSQTYADRALKANKKCSCAHSVFLGTDLSEFDRYRSENPVIKPSNEVWVVYIGTLGANYDLTSVIRALVLVKNKEIRNVRFIVMGDGPRRKEFEKLAQSVKIVSEFTGVLPYPQMVGVLCACDIAVNPIAKGAAVSIINKVADYAMAGLPVINTQECEEYRFLVEQNQMGINCENGNTPALADAIICLARNTSLRACMGENNRRLAEKQFDRAITYETIEHLISSDDSGRNSC